MEKSIIIAVVLGILVLISVVQALQLNALKEKINEGKLTFSKTSSSSSGGSNGQSSGLPSNIQDLPSMVGGC